MTAPFLTPEQWLAFSGQESVMLERLLSRRASAGGYHSNMHAALLIFVAAPGRSLGRRRTRWIQPPSLSPLSGYEGNKMSGEDRRSQTILKAFITAS